MARAWYAVHTIAGHENKVRELITRRAQNEGFWDWDIFEILIPTEREQTTRNGKRTTVDKKVFPSYIFVQMNLTDEMYKLIKGTSGVTGFVQSGNKPIPMPDEDVQRILKNLEAGNETPKIAYNKADIIRVIEGPFSDYMGKIEEVNPEREKLKVLINIFGRETPVELDFSQVERA